MGFGVSRGVSILCPDCPVPCQCLSRHVPCLNGCIIKIHSNLSYCIPAFGKISPILVTPFSNDKFCAYSSALCFGLDLVFRESAVWWSSCVLKSSQTDDGDG